MFISILGSPYRTFPSHTELYRSFSGRIASLLRIFEHKLNRIGVPMLALVNVLFEYYMGRTELTVEMLDSVWFGLGMYG